MLLVEMRRRQASMSDLSKRTHAHWRQKITNINAAKRKHNCSKRNELFVCVLHIIKQSWIFNVHHSYQVRFCNTLKGCNTLMGITITQCFAISIVKWDWHCHLRCDVITHRVTWLHYDLTSLYLLIHDNYNSGFEVSRGQTAYFMVWLHLVIHDMVDSDSTKAIDSWYNVITPCDWFYDRIAFYDSYT